MRKWPLYLLCFLCLSLILGSCTVQKKLARQADAAIFSVPDFAPAHIGICIYEPATGQYLYNYQSDKFFVPASNTKILACYAAMKNLGDSLLALRYVDKGNGVIEIEANGDPSFLHPDFKSQPVLSFLQQQKKIQLTDANWKDNALGMGWAWDDYTSDYMAERSVLPLYGNVARFRQTATQFTVVPSYFQGQLGPDAKNAKGLFSIRRAYGTEKFSIQPSANKFASDDMPFFTGGMQASLLLADTLHIPVEQTHTKMNRAAASKLYSQPTDSLLRIMMHRSDNFFAEQTLLMISNEKLGIMNNSKIIDTLLKSDFASLPQKPKWVDGSGLSRYNLVTPQDFVWVLTQMKNEFKWERITTIFATGGEGTLGGSYKNYAGRIYAKTGTLSNHVALSGYLLTKKGKTLVFSVLVNAHLTAAGNIRKGVEKFLTGVIDKY